MRNEDRLHRRVLAWIRRLLSSRRIAEEGTREAPPQARTPAVEPPKTRPIRPGRRDFAFGCVRPQGEGYQGVVVLNTGEPLHPLRLRQVDADSARQVLAKLLTG